MSKSNNKKVAIQSKPVAKPVAKRKKAKPTSYGKQIKALQENIKLLISTIDSVITVLESMAFPKP